MKMSKALVTIGTFLLLAVIISACSTQMQKEETVTVVAKGVSGTAHTHPANECTKSITHTHPLPSSGKAHKHHYSCKGNSPKSINTHTHPANRCTKSTTHTHPNGNRAHTHKYVCQPNSLKSNVNAHVHPANSMTRSVRHVHPGGNKKHTHHYAR